MSSINKTMKFQQSSIKKCQMANSDKVRHKSHRQNVFELTTHVGVTEPSLEVLNT